MFVCMMFTLHHLKHSLCHASHIRYSVLEKVSSLLFWGQLISTSVLVTFQSNRKFVLNGFSQINRFCWNVSGKWRIFHMKVNDETLINKLFPPARSWSWMSDWFTSQLCKNSRLLRKYILKNLYYKSVHTSVLNIFSLINNCTTAN
jgi:hypothetical protein